MLIRPTYAKVNLGAIKRNVARIKESLPSDTQVCAVDKANGYGHGSVMVAQAAIEAGATFVAVAIPEEAVQLRDAGITASILVLGPASLSQWRLAAELDLSMVVASQECLACAQVVHREIGRTMRLHLKVDTGMNRVGVQTLDQARALLETIAQEDGLLLEGLMTHFAVADGRTRRIPNGRTRFQGTSRWRAAWAFAHRARGQQRRALDCPGTSYDMVRVALRCTAVIRPPR